MQFHSRACSALKKLAGFQTAFRFTGQKHICAAAENEASPRI
jgi:hypothetical protein